MSKISSIHRTWSVNSRLSGGVSRLFCCRRILNSSRCHAHRCDILARILLETLSYQLQVLWPRYRICQDWRSNMCFIRLQSPSLLRYPMYDSPIGHRLANHRCEPVVATLTIPRKTWICCKGFRVSKKSHWVGTNYLHPSCVLRTFQ